MSPYSTAIGCQQGKVDTDNYDRSDGQSVHTAISNDNKEYVTYRFKRPDASLLQKITYDDFGMPKIKVVQASVLNSDRTSTYETKRLSDPTRLFDFGSRGHDLVVDHFIMPDDVLDTDLLTRNHGINSLAFENDDSINHTNPSSHWSLSAVLGAALGVALVGGAVALTVATGGAATPFLAAAAGALGSGGIAGITYSLGHRNERGGKFWGGYAATVLVKIASRAGWAVASNEHIPEEYRDSHPQEQRVHPQKRRARP